MNQKTIDIISWGGGTQSTALMLKALKGELKDSRDKVVDPDYIVFADTGNESAMTYSQVFKVQKYVEETYGRKVIITSKNKEKKPIEEVEEMISSGKIEKYRSSKYVDLFQSHILWYKGLVKSVDTIPSWTRNKVTGKVGKLGMKQCTVAYKINQILKEIRHQEGLKRFSAKKHKLRMFIGFTIDEVGRIKPDQSTYVYNEFPLALENLTKQDCIDYVEKELGFKPKSSVCNVCYANDFEHCYNIYKNDPQGWEKVVELDKAMENKPKDHAVKDDVFLFKWQADRNIRLEGLDMEEMYEKEKNKPKQLSIFDQEQKNACMGGCFI